MTSSAGFGCLRDSAAGGRVALEPTVNPRPIPPDIGTNLSAGRLPRSHMLDGTNAKVCDTQGAEHSFSSLADNALQTMLHR